MRELNTIFKLPLEIFMSKSKKDVFNPNVVQLMTLLGDRAAASLKLQRETQNGGSHRNKSYVLVYG